MTEIQENSPKKLKVETCTVPEPFSMEIWQRIFSFFTPAEAAKSRKVCKCFYLLGEDNIKKSNKDVFLTILTNYLSEIIRAIDHFYSEIAIDDDEDKIESLDFLRNAIERLYSSKNDLDSEDVFQEIWLQNLYPHLLNLSKGEMDADYNNKEDHVQTDYFGYVDRQVAVASANKNMVQTAFEHTRKLLKQLHEIVAGKLDANVNKATI